MKDANHPIWPILRMTVILIALVLVLWLNAAHFDETEINTVLAMFFAVLGVEGLSMKFASKPSNPSS